MLHESLNLLAEFSKYFLHVLVKNVSELVILFMSHKVHRTNKPYLVVKSSKQKKNKYMISEKVDNEAKTEEKTCKFQSLNIGKNVLDKINTIISGGRRLPN
jgi:hypothetical protein